MSESEKTVRTLRATVRCVIAALSCASTSALCMDNWYIAPDVSYTKPDSDLYAEDDVSIGIGIGAELNPWTDLELSYTAARFPLEGMPGLTDRKQLLLGSRFRLDPDNFYSPYLSFNLGAARLKTLGDERIAPVAALGLGYTIPLTMVPGLDVQPEIRALYTRNEGPVREPNEIDGQALLRLRYHPQGARTATTQVSAHDRATVTVTSDYSDVSERPKTARERCDLLAPASAAFSENGCQRMADRDGDAIPDLTDLCPNTIPGVRVDVDGCLIRSTKRG